MTRFGKIALPLSLALSVVVPQVALAQVAAADVAQFAGKPLYGPKGQKIGAVYKVASSGVPQLIINGQLVAVPLATLSINEGKLTTSLDKKQLTKRSR